MSAINGFSGDLPPAKRSRTAGKESQSSVDVLTGLENELSALPEGQYNYDLVRRVEAYRTQHQISSDSSGLQSPGERAFGVFVNTTSARVERLYTNVLAKHHLPANYKGDLCKLVNDLYVDGDPDISRISFLSSFLDDELRGVAVEIAACGGRLNIIEALLANGATISDEHRGEAVSQAAIPGHLNIIEALLANGATISEERRGKSVVNATILAHLNIIEALLANGATISEEHRGKAVSQSAFFGHLNIIEALLANGATISEEHRGEALSEAALMGHLNIIEALLANGTISEEARGRAVVAAASRGHRLIVNAFLANGATISDEHIGEAVENAFRGGHLAILEALLPNGATFFDEHTSSEAFHLEINLEELNRNPMHYLDQIVQRGFPLRVSILESIGLDAGGLRKQFVSYLVQSLQPYLSLVEDKLPLIELTDPKALTNKEILRKFGVFLSNLYEANLQGSDDPCLIGQLFNPRFFDIIKLILDNQSDDQILVPLARILQEINPSLRLVTQVILTPDSAEAKEAFADIFIFNSDRDDITEKAKDMLLGYLEGPKAFAEGLTYQLKAFIQETPCQEICTSLQGQEATAEDLLRALGIQEIDASYETTDLFENQKCWLKEKIISSDPAWRKAFIQWSTGRTTLAFATSITLQSTLTRSLAAHTCSNTIDFPLAATCKEAFLAAFDDLTSDLQYNMA